MAPAAEIVPSGDVRARSHAAVLCQPSFDDAKRSGRDKSGTALGMLPTCKRCGRDGHAHPDCVAKTEAVLWTWTGRRKKRRRPAKRRKAGADVKASTSSLNRAACSTVGSTDGTAAVVGQLKVRCGGSLEAPTLTTETEEDCESGRGREVATSGKDDGAIAVRLKEVGIEKAEGEDRAVEDRLRRERCCKEATLDGETEADATATAKMVRQEQDLKEVELKKADSGETSWQKKLGRFGDHMTLQRGCVVGGV